MNRKAKTARAYKRIFYRDAETLDLTGIPVKYRENLEISLEREVLISSLGAKLKFPNLNLSEIGFYKMNLRILGIPLKVFLCLVFYLRGSLIIKKCRIM